MTAGNVRKLIARLGRDAGLSFPVHPHQLRHACGYALASAGHDTRAVQHWARAPQHRAHGALYRARA
jgi:site-specific recombinase XerD